MEVLGCRRCGFEGLRGDGESASLWRRFVGPAWPGEGLVGCFSLARCPSGDGLGEAEIGCYGVSKDQVSEGEGGPEGPEGADGSVDRDGEQLFTGRTLEEIVGVAVVLQDSASDSEAEEEEAEQVESEPADEDAGIQGGQRGWPARAVRPNAAMAPRSANGPPRGAPR